MAIIAPFRGLLYSASRVSDLAQVISSPAETFTEAAASSRRASHGLSILHLDHPEGEPQDRHESAARTFKLWREDGTLERDARPSLYIAAFRYTSRGMPEKVFRGLYARLRIEDASSAEVRAMESAEERLRQERLSLILSTRAHVSPLVALFSDASGDLALEMEAAGRRPPDRWAVDASGMDIQLWRTSDPAIMGRLARGLAGRTAWIVDGQHIHDAAREARDRLRHDEGGSAPRGSRSYDHVLAFLAPLESAGLTLMPYHRVLRSPRRFNARSLAGGTAGHIFDVKHFSFEAYDNRAEQIRRRLRESAARGRVAIALYAGGGDFSLYLLRQEDLPVEPLASLPEGLRRVDVAVLEAALLPPARSIAHAEDEGSAVRYTESVERSLAWVDAGEGSAAFLINPPSRDDMVTLAGQGLKFPERSACILPRVPSGLVMDALDPVDEVHGVPALPPAPGAEPQEDEA